MTHGPAAVQLTEEQSSTEAVQRALDDLFKHRAMLNGGVTLTLDEITNRLI